MARSLRWRMQLWHAIILVTAIVLFGFAFYRQLRISTYSDIDTQLLSGARVIEGSLRTSALLESDLLQPETFSRITIDAPHQRDGRRPDPDSGTADRRPPRRENDSHRPRPRRHRPEQYFGIFSEEGNLLFSQGDNSFDDFEPGRRRIRRQYGYRNVKDRREVMLRGPHGTLIVVGRDIKGVQALMTRSLFLLIGVGAAVSILGLAGGWWLSGKAIEPIEEITETTKNVTASSLSDRIDTSAMDTELRDLGTELNSMLQRLDDAFHQQLQFTADASHELRTPVTVLLTHTELATSRPRSNDELIDTIGTCRNAAMRMESLVDGLLTLARVDSHQLELEFAEFDLHDLARETMEMFRPFADEQNIELRLEGGSVICKADRQRIGQVIGNLVHNAIAYNQSKGTVVVTTSQSTDAAMLTVKDTGIGIDDDSLEKIFDRFYRVDEARSRNPSDKVAGMGLGLAISKSIVAGASRDTHGCQQSKYRDRVCIAAAAVVGCEPLHQRQGGCVHSSNHCLNCFLVAVTQ